MSGRLPAPLRAPIFLPFLLLSVLLTLPVFASVTVGSWVEAALRRVGITPAEWVPAVLGVMVYAFLGVVGPAYAGWALIGWPGVLLGPALLILPIAWLGRW